MSRKAIKAQALFKPVRSKSETKADITDHQAKAIIQDEAKQREDKTAKLRRARLKHLDQQPEAEAPAKPRAASSPKYRRAISSM